MNPLPLPHEKGKRLWVSWGEYMELHYDFAVRQKQGFRFPPEPVLPASSSSEDVWKLFTTPEVDKQLDRLLTETDEVLWNLIPVDQEIGHLVSHLPPRPPKAPLLPVSEINTAPEWRQWWLKMRGYTRQKRKIDNLVRKRWDPDPPIGCMKELREYLDWWGILKPLPYMFPDVPDHGTKSMQLKYSANCCQCRKALDVGETVLGWKPEGGRWRFECICCSFERLERVRLQIQREEQSLMGPPVGRPTKRAKRVRSID